MVITLTMEQQTQLLAWARRITEAHINAEWMCHLAIRCTSKLVRHFLRMPGRCVALTELNWVTLTSS